MRNRAIPGPWRGGPGHGLDNYKAMSLVCAISGWISKTPDESHESEFCYMEFGGAFDSLKAPETTTRANTSVNSFQKG